MQVMHVSVVTVCFASPKLWYKPCHVLGRYCTVCAVIVMCSRQIDTVGLTLGVMAFACGTFRRCVYCTTVQTVEET